MGRHAATAGSRSAQKWQVAGNRNSEATSEDRRWEPQFRVAADRPCEEKFRAAVDRPCEEKVAGGSTPNSSPTCATLISKSDAQDRERWADIDVESDGEQVCEFDGKHYNGDDAQDPKGDGWSSSGKRSGRMRAKTRPDRAVKPDPPAPVVARATRDTFASSRDTFASSRDTFASSRQATTKKTEVSSAPVPYRPPKSDERKSTSQQDHHYESSNAHQWEASSWGTSGSGWKSSSKSHGSSWDSGTWDQKQDTHRSIDSRKPRDPPRKEKNESFKRGPMVTTNMDASRLAW